MFTGLTSVYLIFWKTLLDTLITREILKVATIADGTENLTQSIMVGLLPCVA